MSELAPTFFASLPGVLFFHLLFTVSICFWGRLVCRLVSGRWPRYGDITSLVAGLAAITLLGWYISRFGPGLDIFFKVVFFLGLAGSLESLLWKARQNRKAGTWSRELYKLRPLLANLALGLALALIYFQQWPSGQLELWQAGNNDLYAWTFISDYWRGLINLDNFGLGPGSIPVEDAVGTYFILGLFASARGQTSLLATPFFVVSLLIWLGIGLQQLAARIFRLPFWLALAVAFGVTAGVMLHYLITQGFLGQLTATLGVVAALTASTRYSGSPWRLMLFNARNLFLPVLLIFLTYQSGLLVLMCLVLLLKGSRSLLEPGSLFRRVTLFFIAGALPLLLTVLLCALLCPSLGLHLISRTIAVSTAINGWPLPVFNPLIFSGLPPLQIKLFLDGRQTIYLPYFLMSAVLALMLFVLSTRSTSSRYTRGQVAALFSFVVCLGLYLAAFLWYSRYTGHNYQAWKFVSLTALPLSFVPPAIIAALFLKYIRKPRSRHLAAVSLLLLAVGLSLWRPQSMFPLLQRADAFPAQRFIDEMHKIKTQHQKADIFILDMSTNNKILMAANIFGADPAQVMSISGIYFIRPITMSTEDYMSLLTEKSVYVDGRSQNGLLDGSWPPRGQESTPVAYTMEGIRDKGLVSYMGLYHPTGGESMVPTRSISGPKAAVNILVPRALWGQDALAVLRVRSRVTQRLIVRSGNIEQNRALKENTFMGFPIPLSNTETASGLVSMSLTLPDDIDDLLELSDIWLFGPNERYKYMMTTGTTYNLGAAAEGGQDMPSPLKALCAGWHGAEPTATWTSDLASCPIYIDDNISQVELVLDILHTVVDQAITVKIGDYVSEPIVASGPGIYVIPINMELTGLDKPLEMEIRAPQAVRPCELSPDSTSDCRLLGLYIQSITIRPKR